MSTLQRKRRSRLFRRHRSQRPEPMGDIYDSYPWTEMDLEDLTAALKSGDTIEEAAEHLCRSGTIDDVRHKAEELGLKYMSRK